MRLSKPAAMEPVYPTPTHMSRQQFIDAVVLAWLTDPDVSIRNDEDFDSLFRGAAKLADARERFITKAKEVRDE